MKKLEWHIKLMMMMMIRTVGSYSNWKRHEPYNHYGNENCAVMETTHDATHWMDYKCSRSDFGALCDLGPGNIRLQFTCRTNSVSRYRVGTTKLLNN